mgnify:CR=1 FL=1
MDPQLIIKEMKVLPKIDVAFEIKRRVDFIKNMDANIWPEKFSFRY